MESEASPYKYGIDRDLKKEYLFNPLKKNLFPSLQYDTVFLSSNWENRRDSPNFVFFENSNLKDQKESLLFGSLVLHDGQFLLKKQKLEGTYTFSDKPSLGNVEKLNSSLKKYPEHHFGLVEQQSGIEKDILSLRLLSSDKAISLKKYLADSLRDTSDIFFKYNTCFDQDVLSVVSFEKEKYFYQLFEKKNMKKRFRDSIEENNLIENTNRPSYQMSIFKKDSQRMNDHQSPLPSLENYVQTLNNGVEQIKRSSSEASKDTPVHNTFFTTGDLLAFFSLPGGVKQKDFENKKCIRKFEDKKKIFEEHILMSPQNFDTLGQNFSPFGKAYLTDKLTPLFHFFSKQELNNKFGQAKRTLSKKKSTSTDYHTFLRSSLPLSQKSENTFFLKKGFYSKDELKQIFFKIKAKKNCDTSLTSLRSPRYGLRDQDLFLERTESSTINTAKQLVFNYTNYFLLSSNSTATPLFSKKKSEVKDWKKEANWVKTTSLSNCLKNHLNHINPGTPAGTELNQSQTVRDKRSGVRDLSLTYGPETAAGILKQNKYYTKTELSWYQSLNNLAPLQRGTEFYQYGVANTPKLEEHSKLPKYLVCIRAPLSILGGFLFFSLSFSFLKLRNFFSSFFQIFKNKQDDPLVLKNQSSKLQIILPTSFLPSFQDLHTIGINTNILQKNLYSFKVYALNCLSFRILAFFILQVYALTGNPIYIYISSFCLFYSYQKNALTTKKSSKTYLLSGLSGIGKSTFFEALIHEIKVLGLQTQVSSPKNVKDILSTSRFYKPCVLFLDRLETIGYKREYTNNFSPLEQNIEDFYSPENRFRSILGERSEIGDFSLRAKRRVTEFYERSELGDLSYFKQSGEGTKKRQKNFYSFHFIQSLFSEWAKMNLVLSVNSELNEVIPVGGRQYSKAWRTKRRLNGVINPILLKIKAKRKIYRMKQNTILSKTISRTDTIVDIAKESKKEKRSNFVSDKKSILLSSSSFSSRYTIHRSPPFPYQSHTVKDTNIERSYSSNTRHLGNLLRKSLNYSIFCEAKNQKRISNKANYESENLNSKQKKIINSTSLLGLLVYLDTASESNIVLGSTYNVDLLDRALLRPGRFNTLLYFSFPEGVDRINILKCHTGLHPFSSIGSDISWNLLADLTKNFIPSHLSLVIEYSFLLQFGTLVSQRKTNLYEHSKVGDKSLQASLVTTSLQKQQKYSIINTKNIFNTTKKNPMRLGLYKSRKINHTMKSLLSSILYQKKKFVF
uniref:Cell division protein FTSH n=1 Tax=Microrhizoidea pickettheapsiorum TaxID=2604950 RepID=A0A5B9RFN3_9CHLO|nr:cell division protein FTSH [Microrhizoidea pickettheapsiorum]QEG77671.1 cell division protein FTSH [Microrhizoidea pickettheapsiorum]